MDSLYLFLVIFLAVDGGKVHNLTSIVQNGRFLVSLVIISVDKAVAWVAR